ncbi:hypothetical protein ONS96_005648 [Cadophora gregata f. sp. sojae]|nr:hypothetical protein ONS96_005648 [Cadophora gregata f. sp. sojae]
MTPHVEYTIKVELCFCLSMALACTVIRTASDVTLFCTLACRRAAETTGSAAYDVVQIGHRSCRFLYPESLMLHYLNEVSFSSSFASSGRKNSPPTFIQGI